MNRYVLHYLRSVEEEYLIDAESIEEACSELEVGNYISVTEWRDRGGHVLSIVLVEE
jgi:hypothetical protein